jgi:hypothetical protein
LIQEHKTKLKNISDSENLILTFVRLGLVGKIGLSLDKKGLKRREYTNARSKNWLSSSGCLVAEAWGRGEGEGYYDNFGQIDHYNLLRLGRTYEAIKNWI